MVDKGLFFRRAVRLVFHLLTVAASIMVGISFLLDWDRVSLVWAIPVGISVIWLLFVTCVKFGRHYV